MSFLLCCITLNCHLIKLQLLRAEKEKRRGLVTQRPFIKKINLLMWSGYVANDWFPVSQQLLWWWCWISMCYHRNPMLSNPVDERWNLRVSFKYMEIFYSTPNEDHIFKITKTLFFTILFKNFLNLHCVLTWGVHFTITKW